MTEKFNPIVSVGVHSALSYARTIFVLALTALLLTACIEPMENYEHPAEPRFEGQYAPLDPVIGDSIKVVFSE